MKLGLGQDLSLSQPLKKELMLEITYFFCSWSVDSYAVKASPHEVLLPENSMEPADYD
jgi:hypothetical protein